MLPHPSPSHITFSHTVVPPHAIAHPLILTHPLIPTCPLMLLSVHQRDASSEDEEGGDSGSSPLNERRNTRDLRDKREAQARRMLEHQVGSSTPHTLTHAHIHIHTRSRTHTCHTLTHNKCNASLFITHDIYCGAVNISTCSQSCILSSTSPLPHLLCLPAYYWIREHSSPSQ